MRLLFSIVAAFAAVLCMGLVGIASASAAEFEGSPVGAKLEAEALATQVFEAGGKEGLKVKCSLLKVIKGEVEKTKALTQDALIEYAMCEETAGNLEVNNIQAEYEFSADGTASVLKPVLIETKVAGECMITVPTQNALGSIAYTNLERNGHKGVEIIPSVTKIKSEGAGNKQKPCNYTLKESEEAHTNEGGKYKGESFVWAVGGEVKWTAL